MAKSLGEKIKHLRKALKLTQSDLAGGEMTKSMLSQIENNIAMPSMKNLQYIAARLNKPVAYFVDDGAYQAALPIEEIHEELRNASQLINNRKPEEALSILEAMLSKYKFDFDSKIYADFLTKYGECLIELNNHESGEEKLKKAVDIYKEKFLFIEAAKAYLLLIGIPWNEFNYIKCLDILEQSIDIYNNSINKDYPFEIKALHIRSILYAGLDRLEDCIQAASQALSISKQTNIYYESDELHKVIAIMNGFLGNFADFEKHIEKARQFATFIENSKVLASIEGACALYHNQINKPQIALEYIEKALNASNIIDAFAYTEKLKALYMLGEYQQALACANQIIFPAYIPFKYDYLHLWSSKIYEGLILNKLSKTEEAAYVILSAIQKIEIVGPSKTLSFAYKSLSEVYSAQENYENAFAALKKSTEIDGIAKENRLYY